MTTDDKRHPPRPRPPETVKPGQVVQRFSHGRSHIVTVEVKRRRRSPTSSLPTKASAENAETLDAEARARKLALERVRQTHAQGKTVLRPYADPPLPPLEQKPEPAPSPAKESSQARVAPPSVRTPADVNTPPSPAGRRDSHRRHSVEDDQQGTPKTRKKTHVRTPDARRLQNLKRFYPGDTEDVQGVQGQRTGLHRHGTKKSMQKISRTVALPVKIAVRELANLMAEKVGVVLKKAMALGMKLTINDTVDASSAELIVMELGHKATREQTHSEQLETLYEEAKQATAGVPTPRPPIITVMGHVDHGKTSLLDALRRSNVTAKEAGGITQHIGASQVKTADGKILTFIDTPGHAAFTAMRARGAHVTDIVILLVAADDSVKEQTVEAIHHAKASGAPIVVVINKIDKPEANPDRVRQDLLGHEIVVEGMGGDIQDVEVSAQTGQGLDKLTESLLLQAELLELKADPDAPAQGTVLEAKVDRKRGVLATVLVQGGTLKPGQTFVAGTTTGRVRWMMNNVGQSCKQAQAGTPVEIMGFSTPPMAGDDFLVTRDEKTATAIAELRQDQQAEKKADVKPISALQALLQGKKSEVKELTIIVRADAQGSLEAVCGALTKIEHDEVAIKILHRGVGTPSESDVDLAQASGALLLAFGVPITSALKEKAKAVGVEAQQYDIIYKLVESIRDLLAGLLSPLTQEVALGKAEIRKVFSIKKMGNIAGCYVTQGVIKRNAMARIKTGGTLRFETTIETLKRQQSDVKEAKEGYECGIMFESKAAFEEGDTIEVFEMENIKRTLDDKAPAS